MPKRSGRDGGTAVHERSALREKLGDERMDALLEECIRDGWSLLDRIDEALAGRDDLGLASAVHHLATTCSLIGGRDVSAACVSVETSLRGGDVVAAHHRARTLRSRFGAVAAELRSKP
jgi:HPt (histidine-containing phosphotransfer) domain-containing protein